VQIPTLHTARLELRAYVATDRAAFIATYTDPEVMQYVDGALEPEAAGALFDGILSGGRHRVFAAWCAERGGVTVGHGALLREDDGLALGYILPRKHWGHGYATEIAQALVQYAIDSLGRTQLTATTDPENIASGRVLEKAGMRLVARVDNVDGPHLVYQAIASNKPT